MNERELQGPPARPLVPFLSYLLLLSYPLLSFIWRRDYPFLSAEVLVLLGVALVTSALLALLTARFGRPVGTILTAMAVTAAFLVQFDMGMLAALVCLGASLLLAWSLWGRFHSYALPVLGALILGAWLDSSADDGRIHHQETAPTVNAHLPPVVHIILDGFTGLEGLPPYPASAMAAREVQDFFSAYGFRIFPKAYSRYFTTGDSMYSALNFRHDGASAFGLEVAAGKEHSMADNAYFDGLEGLGYRFSVYQTGHLDFCRSHAPSMDRCWQYPHPNVATIRQVPGTGERIGMLAKVLLMQSSLFIKSARNWMVDPFVAVHDPRVLTNLREDIVAGPDGRVFFAHVLLPHGPFAFLHDCSVRYAEDKRLRYAFMSNDPEMHPSVYEHRSLRYFEQMDCALASLRNLFDTMQAAGSFERAIFVLHGDHGSGIVRKFPGVWNRGEITPQDFRSAFSTLFAYRFPGGGFGSDSRALPLGSLLEAVAKRISEYAIGGVQGDPFESALRIDPDQTAPYVYLQGTIPLSREDVDIFAY